MKTSSKEEENFDIVFGEKACNDLSDKLDQFKLIYEEAFPKKEEREDFDAKIRERLKAGDKPQNENHPQTIAYLMYTDSQKQRMVGGLIGDWYPKVQMLELIYMAVDKNLRRDERKAVSDRPHYGRTLLQKGAMAICKHLKPKDPKKIRIFFEAENPFDDTNADDYEQTIGRFRFFFQSGGYRLPIEYVQPPLEINGEYARNLCLFVLSLEEGKNSKKSIPYKKLQDFIDAFYDGLKDNIAEDDKSGLEEFEATRKKLKRNIMDVADSDDNVPFDIMGEIAHLHYSKVAVATHFEILDEEIPQKMKLEEGKICPDWGSYESDLFNYHNQDSKPFKTHLATSTPIENVTLPLPRIYQYTSEGRSYCKLSQRNSVQVDVSVSWSARKYGKITVRIAHLALIPHQEEITKEEKANKETKGKNVKKEPSYFTELELIKIIAGLGFGSKQEQYTLLKKDRDAFDGFFERILKDTLGCTQFKALKTGITEINMKGLSRHGSVGNWTTYQRNVLCGILLGIFDYTRMSPVEANVTLRSIYEFPKVNMFYYASRGHLLRIMERTKSEEENLQNLLISPYLVIPSAALCYNENLLRDKAEQLSKKDFKNRWRRLKGVSPVKRALSADFLTDIFQYESEKHILNRIMVGRSQLQERSRLLEKSRLRQTKTAHFLEALQATILAAIAVSQLYGRLEGCPTLFWWIFGGVVGMFLFYSIYRLCQ